MLSVKMFKHVVVFLLFLACGIQFAECNMTTACTQKELSTSFLEAAIDMIEKVNCGIECNRMSPCNHKELSTSYLKFAVDMIKKAKSIIPICNSDGTRRAVDCTDVLQMGYNESGVYKIWPQTLDKSVDVYCDMQTDEGGWTVIQRRGDFQRPIDYFYRDWSSYKEGFGDLEQDFWLGNDNIYALTNQRLYSARFDLKDVEGTKRYAEYVSFRIDDENNKYTLHVSNYSGDAGDSIIPRNNNCKFSTKDQDNDNGVFRSCAEEFKGAWWYNNCHLSNLNGLYYKGKHESYADGVNWYTFKGEHESLEWTEIKIRPVTFKWFEHHTNVV